MYGSLRPPPGAWWPPICHSKALALREDLLTYGSLLCHSRQAMKFRGAPTQLSEGETEYGVRPHCLRQAERGYCVVDNVGDVDYTFVVSAGMQKRSDR
jgi:hypothetical protein